ncbi:Protein of unknown function DUF724 [Cynara cardunculus var. scolymus]|uniref:Agenet-like domain-containing protein n=1 Tax=Cynara cardunculus var. scolymus TaxID=59895 RepID=A0A103XPF5_CYNCS|nr:Protein of unknown function DUF724 [Cynara cardunculus var. scolymus]
MLVYRKGNTSLPKGWSQVEVKSQEEGFHLVATVTRRPPPISTTKKVSKLCRHHSEWCTGVTTGGVEPSNSVVTFYRFPQFRIFESWVDGKWVRPEEQEPVCNDGHSVENAVERGESSSLKCITEGIATVSLNFKDSVEDTSHTTSGIDEQTSIVTSMKRAKLTSIGSNDKHLKPSKKSKSGISSDDPSVSSVGKSKEVSNPPAGQSWGCNSQEANTSDQTFDNIENLPHGNKMCKALTYSRTKKQLGPPLAPETTGNVEVTEVDTNSITKRKRGRPRKLPLKIPETSLAVNHQNGDALQGLGFVEGSKMNASIKVESGKENPEVNVDKPLNRSSGKALTVQHEKPKIVKGRRGKRRTISSINIEASPQGATIVKIHRNKKQMEGWRQMVRQEIPNLLSRNISTQCRMINLSRVAAQQRKVEQSSDASKKQLENLEICPAVANGEMVADDGGNLSFVKSSPLWETLESMEVFRMIPQNPHFRLLNSLKESAREGQAISQMVNFSKVVENTSQLRFDCPRNTIEECLEVLVELEIHGFDVKLIRDRLTGLLLIKDKQEELEARWKEVGDKIERVNVEGGRDDEEIELLDKKIRELLERRSQILAKKEKMGSEQGGLEVEIDGIKEGLNEIRYKFDGLAAASLCPP